MQNAYSLDEGMQLDWGWTGFLLFFSFSMLLFLNDIHSLKQTYRLARAHTHTQNNKRMTLSPFSLYLILPKRIFRFFRLSVRRKCMHRLRQNYTTSPKSENEQTKQKRVEFMVKWGIKAKTETEATPLFDAFPHQIQFERNLFFTKT